MAAMPDLGKMYGPLPLGAWLAVIGGGLGLALYTRYQSDGEGPTDPDLQPSDTSGTPGVGTGGSWQAVSPPTTPVPVAPEPVTNEEWGRAAINWLIASGYDPATADSAIRKYLESAKLSAKEYVMVTLALGRLGATPYPLPAPIFGPPTLPTTPVTPPPPVVTPPVKPPTKVRYHTVRPGETLSGLAKKYYKNGHNWGPIFNANKAGKRRSDGKMGMIKNPNLIRVGWVLIIP